MADDRKAKLAETNFWDKLLTLRDQQRAQMAKGIAIIKQAE